MENKKVVAIIQARLGSIRLPNKIIKYIHGKTILEHLIDRLRLSELLDDIVVATTINPNDNKIVDFCKKINVKCFRGSEDDVLDRYYQAANKYKVDIIVRICSDLIFIDPKILDSAIKSHIENNADFTHNKHDKGMVLVTSFEIINKKTLDKINKLSTKQAEREHVTFYIDGHPEGFKINLVDVPKDIFRPNIRLVVDEEDDLKLIRAIYDRLYKGKIINLRDVVGLLDKEPSLLEINKGVQNKNLAVLNKIKAEAVKRNKNK